jgi:WD40 repeat protein
MNIEKLFTHLSDGRFLSCSLDNTLRLWSSDGKPLGILKGHSDQFNGAEILPDGRILSWSRDKTLRLWSSDSESLRVLDGHSDSVEGALVLPDQRILSWSGDRTLRLWSCDGELLEILNGHSDSVEGALAIPSGRILSWSRDDTLCIWADDGTLSAVMKDVGSFRILSDGRILSWSVQHDRWFDHCFIFLWSSDGALTKILFEDNELCSSLNVELSLDGKILSWTEDSELRLWSEDCEYLATMQGHTEKITGAHFIPGGMIFSWSEDETIRIWESSCNNFICKSIVYTGEKIYSAKAHESQGHLFSTYRNGLKIVKRIMQQGSTFRPDVG